MYKLNCLILILNNINSILFIANVILLVSQEIIQILPNIPKVSLTLTKTKRILIANDSFKKIVKLSEKDLINAISNIFR